METLRSYNNVGEAGFAQSLLEASGIPASLEHEAATSLSPAGVSAVRLQVPCERFAEAERILAEHPIHFSGPAENLPRFGFWRGSLYGLVVGAALLLLLRLCGLPLRLLVLILLVAWWLGGVIGANRKVHTPVPGDRPA
jgi:hypothetical protein